MGRGLYELKLQLFSVEVAPGTPPFPSRSASGNLEAKRRTLIFHVFCDSAACVADFSAPVAGECAEGVTSILRLQWLTGFAGQFLVRARGWAHSKTEEQLSFGILPGMDWQESVWNLDLEKCFAGDPEPEGTEQCSS